MSAFEQEGPLNHFVVATHCRGHLLVDFDTDKATQSAVIESLFATQEALGWCQADKLWGPTVACSGLCLDQMQPHYLMMA